MYRPATFAAALLLILPAGAYADGQLAYEGRASSSGALLLRAPGGKQVKRLSAPGTPVDPAFSPTGRRLAFTSRDEIWVMYEDGTNVRQVTLGTEPNRDPTWSPAGDELAFTAGSRGRRDLVAVSADGRVLRQLTSGSGDDQSPAWSSDDVLAFVRDGDVYGLPGRGGRLRRLTRGAAEDRSPAWSADGRRIAFTRLAAKRPRKKGRRLAPKPIRELWVMRSGGAFERRVKRLPGPVAAPAWSPDGRRIAFVMTVKGRRGLYTIRSDGRGLRRVAASARGARSLDWQPRGPDPIVGAAGDIACDPVSDRFDVGLGTSGACHMVQTSDVLLRMDLSAIAVLGDVQYEDATFDKFMRSFHPTWGRLKNLMRPAVGNHEYRVPGAAGYFDYFNGVGVFDGPAGPRDKGYYSYDLGRWHVVVLNSQCSHESGPNPYSADCGAGSPQERWLRADLAANPSRCTLAYWHHPLVSTGLPGFNEAVQPLYQALVDGGVDVLLTGHDHGYERFAPMDATATRDTARGVRQFVVGTGGKNLEQRSFPPPNSEVRENSTFGVLKLALRPSAYLWEFVPETGAAFTDAGANACH